MVLTTGWWDFSGFWVQTKSVGLTCFLQGCNLNYLTHALGGYHLLIFCAFFLREKSASRKEKGGERERQREREKKKS